jgi:hypothetical protein
MKYVHAYIFIDECIHVYAFQFFLHISMKIHIYAHRYVYISKANAVSIVCEVRSNTWNEVCL